MFYDISSEMHAASNVHTVNLVHHSIESPDGTAALEQLHGNESYKLHATSRSVVFLSTASFVQLAMTAIADVRPKRMLLMQYILMILYCMVQILLSGFICYKILYIFCSSERQDVEEYLSFNSTFLSARYEMEFF